MNRQGIFIVFEGIDGCGKDTHIEFLSEKLIAMGFAIVKTHEPWDSEEAALVKKIAKEGNREISPEDEAELYLLDRYKHVHKVISPAINDGRIVLCNRYYYSTMAYQGALGADSLKIKEDNEKLVPLPDLVLMLKVSVEEGLRRIEARGKGISKGYEQIDYLKKVSDIIYNIKGHMIKTIDTERPYKVVSDEIFAETKKVISAKMGFNK
jgi:dTMP kinase